MATCANCIHHSLCDYNTNISGNGKVRLVYAEGADVKCSFFQNTADVVPKSEVEMLQGALKAEERHNELTMEMAQKALENAKAEVAREIFAEIEEYFTKPKGVWFWQMDLAKIAELKKKYIPQEPVT